MSATILQLPDGFRALRVDRLRREFTCADSSLEFYYAGEEGGPAELLGVDRYEITPRGQEPIWAAASETTLVGVRASH